ncbi:hypothetical protein PFDG_05242, partial [Plasmodium falciparum Dd2]
EKKNKDTVDECEHCIADVVTSSSLNKINFKESLKKHSNNNDDNNNNNNNNDEEKKKKLLTSNEYNHKDINKIAYDIQELSYNNIIYDNKHIKEKLKKNLFKNIENCI